jgi:hypothetical protein
LQKELDLNSQNSVQYGIFSNMTKPLESAFRRVKLLPSARHDDLGEIILTLVEQDSSVFQLDDEQVMEIERRLANPETPIPFESVLNQFNIQF